MADDTVDQARKIQDQLNESFRRGAKTVQVTADQIRIMASATDILSEASKAATKQLKEQNQAMIDVSTAFATPSDTFVRLMDEGVTRGQDLLKVFGAIAGLMYDKPINDANKALDKEKAILADLEKANQKEIETGEDALKNLEDKLKKEKDFCDKVTKCDESKIKSLEDQVKTEGDKIAKQKEGGGLDNKAIADQKKKVEQAQKHLEKEKLIGEAVQKFIASFADAFDRFVDLDKAASNFRKELGLSRDAAQSLENLAISLNQKFVSIGVSIEGAYKSLVALGKVFGTSLLINEQLAKTSSLLAANYGVAESNSAGFLQKMKSVGGLTDKQASTMAGLTANLANAAGVNLDEVMQDIANASDETVTLMRGNVKQMTLAAIQAKQLGVSLDKSTSSAKGLLNFTQSVSDEMEASVLLGKNLNLNAARQLAFQGDAAGAQKEILNQVRSMGDFNKMNVFQQEALAKATGYSAVELSKMLKNEEELSKLSKEQRDAQSEALEAFKEQNEKTAEQILMQEQVQSAMAQLNNVFGAFKQILSDILTPVVNVAVKLLIPVLKIALAIFNAILVPVKVIAQGLDRWFQSLNPFLKSFNLFMNDINASIESAVQWLVPFGVAILKIVAPIDFIIKRMTFMVTAVRKVGVSIYNWGKAINSFSSFLSPVGNVVKFIGSLISSIGQKLNNIRKAGSVLTPIFSGTAGVFARIARFASGITGPIRGLISGFGSAAGVVGKFATGFGKVGRIIGILTTAGKAIPVVGEIIMVLQAVWGMFTRLKSGMGFFDALGETLYDVFVGPFEMLVDLLSKIPFIGKLFEGIKPIFGVIKTAFSTVFKTFQEGFDAIKNLFSGKDILKSVLSIGKMVLTGMLLVPRILLESILGLFSSMWTSITELFSGGLSGIWDTLVEGIKTLLPTIGNLLIDGLTSFGQMWYDLFIQPWVTAWDFVSDLFMGKSNSTLGEGIIKGLIGVGSAILSIFTAPFEFIFQMIMKGFASIGTFIQTVLSAPFKIVGKLIGVDTGGIGGGAEKATEKQDSVITAIEQTNQKLDTLINLMMNGGIAVNLDGRKVSEQLAIAST